MALTVWCRRWPVTGIMRAFKIVAATHLPSWQATELVRDASPCTVGLLCWGKQSTLMLGHVWVYPADITRRIVAAGGVELIEAAMTRHWCNSKVQRAGCDAVRTVVTDAGACVVDEVRSQEPLAHN